MTWLDGWERIEGNDAGTWAPGPRHPKLVLHTTEGGSIDGAVRAYRAKNAWPHVTVDPRRRNRAQHVPFNRPARALRNRPGGVELGRAPIVIQVEIVAYAANAHQLPAADLDWLGTDVVGPLCRVAGIPMRTDVTFYGESAGWVLASETARQRLSGPAWLHLEGLVGHQHAPENTHWDPGALDVRRILIAALNGGTPTPTPTPAKEDPLMALTDDEAHELLEKVRGMDLRVQELQTELVGITDDKGQTRMDRLVKRVDEALGLLRSKG